MTPASLPLLTAWYGPATRRRVRRLLLGYAALLLVGAGLAVAATTPWLQVFGLGLMWPGAGFLADGAMACMGLATLGLGVSVVVWFATGNAVAPPMLWLASAMWAAAVHGNAEQSWVCGVWCVGRTGTHAASASGMVGFAMCDGAGVAIAWSGLVAMAKGMRTARA